MHQICRDPTQSAAVKEKAGWCCMRVQEVVWCCTSARFRMRVMVAIGAAVRGVCGGAVGRVSENGVAVAVRAARQQAREGAPRVRKCAYSMRRSKAEG